MELTKKCVICGKEFYTIKAAQKYCGPTCRSTKFRITTLARRKKSEAEAKNCKECGQEFKTTNARKIFCCQNCNFTYHNKKRPKSLTTRRVCPTCGRGFMSADCRRGVGKMYCSTKCKSKAARTRNKSHEVDRNWESRKKNKMGGNWWKALQRDQFTCQICNKKRYPSQWSKRGKNKFVVHHLDGTGESSARNHNIDNLMTLCENCHKLFHTKVNLVYRDGEFVVSGKIFKILDIGSVKTTT